MPMTDAPEGEPAERDSPDPRARYQSWRAFLFVAVGVNALYLWGMLNQMGDPSTAGWYKALTWLPFNVITTVLYYVFYMKLVKHDADAPRGIQPARMFYAALCMVMVVVNWSAMIAA